MATRFFQGSMWAAAVCLLASAAWAQDAPGTTSNHAGNAAAVPAKAPPSDGVLAYGGDGIEVTLADVEAQAELRVPPERRKAALADEATLHALVREAYLEKQVLARAAQLPEGAQPSASAMAERPALQRARRVKAYWERYTSDSLPKPEVMEGYAQSFYKTISADQLQAPERIHLAQIFIAKGSYANAMAVAEPLRARAAAPGADFAALAQAYSDDVRSKNAGGDLGFLEWERLREGLREAAMALPEDGSVSPVVEMPEGYHILKRIERRPAGLRQYDEVESNIKAGLGEKLRKDAYEAEVQKIWAGMKVNEDGIKALARTNAALLSVGAMPEP